MKPTAPPKALVREYLDVLRPHRWVLRAVGVVPAVGGGGVERRQVDSGVYKMELRVTDSNHTPMHASGSRPSRRGWADA